LTERIHAKAIIEIELEVSGIIYSGHGAVVPTILDVQIRQPDASIVNTINSNTLKWLLVNHRKEIEQAIYDQAQRWSGLPQALVGSGVGAPLNHYARKSRRLTLWVKKRN